MRNADCQANIKDMRYTTEGLHTECRWKLACFWPSALEVYMDYKEINVWPNFIGCNWICIIDTITVYGGNENQGTFHLAAWLGATKI
jgi:hypothetical protein